MTLNSPFIKTKSAFCLTVGVGQISSYKDSKNDKRFSLSINTN